MWECSPARARRYWTALLAHGLAATAAKPTTRWLKQRAQQVTLPFKGDGILAVILSKAFLLAADRDIKELSIVRQIQR